MRVAAFSDVHGNTIALDAVRRARHPSGAFIIDWLSATRAPWWEISNVRR